MSTKPLKKIVTCLEEWEQINRKARDFLMAGKDRSFLTLLRSDYEIRSLEQNNYYHGVVIPTIENFMLQTHKKNVTAEKIHKDLKKSFFPAHMFIDEAGELEKRRSTKEYMRQFNESLECVWAHYDLNGCFIPKPNEVITVNKEILLF